MARYLNLREDSFAKFQLTTKNNRTRIHARTYFHRIIGSCIKEKSPDTI
jgi:hypothetical protein